MLNTLIAFTINVHYSYVYSPLWQDVKVCLATNITISHVIYMVQYRTDNKTYNTYLTDANDSAVYKYVHISRLRLSVFQILKIFQMFPTICISNDRK